MDKGNWRMRCCGEQDDEVGRQMAVSRQLDMCEKGKRQEKQQNSNRCWLRWFWQRKKQRVTGQRKADMEDILLGVLKVRPDKLSSLIRFTNKCVGEMHVLHD